MTNNNKYYFNYKCRKCGQILYKVLDERFIYSPAQHMYITKKHHDCLEGIAETEHVVLDYISYSEEPLEGAKILNG